MTQEEREIILAIEAFADKMRYEMLSRTQEKDGWQNTETDKIMSEIKIRTFDLPDDKQEVHIANYLMMLNYKRSKK